MGLVGSTPTWSVPALAQRPVPVVGFLHPGPNPSHVAAFRRGLEQAGFSDGRNVAVEYRLAGGRFERLAALAAELVAEHVDIIVTSGSTAATLAAKARTFAAW
jgi:putative ABC transport system substrate-binding protein